MKYLLIILIIFLPITTMAKSSKHVPKLHHQLKALKHHKNKTPKNKNIDTENNLEQWNMKKDHIPVG